MGINFDEFYKNYQAQKDQTRKKFRATFFSDANIDNKTANFSKSENTAPRKAYFTEQTQKLQYEAEKIFDSGEIRYTDSVRAAQAEDPVFACDLTKLELNYKTFNLDGLGIPNTMKTSMIYNTMNHKTIKARVPVRRQYGIVDVIFKTVPDGCGKYSYTIIDFAE